MKKCIVLRLAITLLIFSFITANATVWYVHPDSLLNSIQAGIDASSTGDTVLVAKGTYIENINFMGKAITVKSEMGADSTIIDGGSPLIPDTGSVVYFVSWEDTNSVLDGFTLTNGLGTYIWQSGIYFAGGIYCSYSSPTIIENTITGNIFVKGIGYGGGIHCNHSSPKITGNTITYNTVDSAAGGIACFDHSSPTITDNTIKWNKAGTYGCGIVCWNHSSPTITGNTITDNTAGRTGGGIECWYYSNPTITGNTITNNTAADGGGIICWTYSSPTIIGNTITDNTAGRGGGIMCWYYSSPTITDNIINSNDREGIHCQMNSIPLINLNNIINNTGHGVRNIDPSVTVDAEDNWWGDATGPYHPDSNPGGLGDSVSSYVDFNPWLTESSGIEGEELYIEFFFLSQGNPNPFIDRTQIEYTLPKISNVNISVYNVLGARVNTLLNKRQNTSKYTITWDGRDERGNKLPSGFYFLRIEAGEYEGTRKLLLIR